MEYFYFYFFLSVRQEINWPPPPGSPPSPLGHPPRGSHPSAPTPPPSPPLPEGRSMEHSPMTREGRGQLGSQHTGASKPHHPSQPECMCLLWIDGSLPSVPSIGP